MSALIAGAAVGVASLGYGVYKDAHQASQAKKIEASNIRPVQQVDPLYQQNVNTAQNMAQQGTPQAVINQEQNNINQNQAGAVSTINSSGGRAGNLASVVRAGDNASATVNAQQAAARNKNTLALIQSRGIMAGANKDAWNYNYADKYSENLAKSQALRGAAAQTGDNTINAAGQFGMSLANSRRGIYSPGSQPYTPSDSGYIDSGVTPV